MTDDTLELDTHQSHEQPYQGTTSTDTRTQLNYNGDAHLHIAHAQFVVVSSRRATDRAYHDYLAVDALSIGALRPLNLGVPVLTPPDNRPRQPPAHRTQE